MNQNQNQMNNPMEIMMNQMGQNNNKQMNMMNPINQNNMVNNPQMNMINAGNNNNNNFNMKNNNNFNPNNNNFFNNQVPQGMIMGNNNYQPPTQYNYSMTNLKSDVNLLINRINKSIILEDHTHPLYSCFTPQRADNSKFWACKKCLYQYDFNIPSFLCTACDYDICQNCIMQMPLFKLKFYNYSQGQNFNVNTNINYFNYKPNLHKHILTLIQIENYENQQCVIHCRACKGDIKYGDKFFYCSLCNFYVCPNCFNNNKQQVQSIYPNSQTNLQRNMNINGQFTRYNNVNQNPNINQGFKNDNNQIMPNNNMNFNNNMGNNNINQIQNNNMNMMQNNNNINNNMGSPMQNNNMNNNMGGAIQNNNNMNNNMGGQIQNNNMNNNMGGPIQNNNMNNNNPNFNNNQNQNNNNMVNPNNNNNSQNPAFNPFPQNNNNQQQNQNNNSNGQKKNSELEDYLSGKQLQEQKEQNASS